MALAKGQQKLCFAKPKVVTEPRPASAGAVAASVALRRESVLGALGSPAHEPGMNPHTLARAHVSVATQVTPPKVVLGVQKKKDGPWQPLKPTVLAATTGAAGGNLAVCEQLRDREGLAVIAPVANNEAGLTVKRNMYTPAQKQSVLKLGEKLGVGSKGAATVASAQPGFEKVNPSMAHKWKKKKQRRKSGPKVDDEFEQEVKDQLIFTSAEKIKDKAQSMVVANVAYSYDIIKQAARKVQRQEKFQNKEDGKAKGLKFTNPWIVGWLKRMVLRRRRVTTEDKQLPPVPVVRRRMKKIQNRILGKDRMEGLIDDKPAEAADGETAATEADPFVEDNELSGLGLVDGKPYKDDEVCSTDETAVFLGAKPKNQFVPKTVAWGSSPEDNDKARFTSLLHGFANGDMGSSFNVIKCDVKDPYDLSTTWVLDNLMKQPGFGTADGWTKKMWERKMTLQPRSSARTGS
jgi:hypothetical protein